MKEHCCTSAQQSPTTNERTYKQQKAWMEEVYPSESPANSRRAPFCITITPNVFVSY